MATITASPPPMSPPLAATNTNQPQLPSLITTTAKPRKTSAQRPVSWVERRTSSYSSTSRASHQRQSRPSSHVFPIFHSSLSYTYVRDFAYPLTHALHYGPPPTQSDVSTPVSEARRLSDPAVASWEDSRGRWSPSPPWINETTPSSSSRDQLPAMAFNDGGPPYSEDEDIQSPIVTTARHRRHQSGTGNNDRGRSPGAAGPDRGMIVDAESEYSGHDETGEPDGPGGVIINYPSGAVRHPRQQSHRDSNFARPLRRDRSPHDAVEPTSEDDGLEVDDEARYSKDYSFTIASPDEEMHGKAVALFDFESEHQNELPLKEGQIILVSYRHGQGWLVAEDPRTGESGLVPEEFVRLVRDIEGGLNGLNSMNLDDGNGDHLLSPISNDPSSATTPTAHQQEFSSQPGLSKSSNGNNNGKKHPSIQSSFSTSTRDFSPYRLPGRNEEHVNPTARLSGQDGKFRTPDAAS